MTTGRINQVSIPIRGSGTFRRAGPRAGENPLPQAHAKARQSVNVLTRRRDAKRAEARHLTHEVENRLGFAYKATAAQGQRALPP